MRKLLFSLLSYLTFVSIASASTTLPDNLLDELLACSPSYFASLVPQRHVLQRLGYKTTAISKVLRIDVDDRKDLEGTKWLVKGREPFNLATFQMIGFFDLQKKANTYSSYSWGILVKGEPQKIAEKLNQVRLKNWPLEFDGLLSFARLSRSKEDFQTFNWKPVLPLPTQSIPEEGVIELVLEVAPADESLEGVSRLGCSVQGNFRADLLKQIRPDIE
jgi:hypothetical protein